MKLQTVNLVCSAPVALWNCTNRPSSIDQYFKMAPRLSGQMSMFGGVSLYPSLFWELEDEGNLKTLQF